MPKITLSGPADLLTAIPFQLGFQPSRSVVVVCFHGKRLGLVVRLDVVPREDADGAAAQLLPTLAREAPSSVAVIGFEERAGESMSLGDALSDAIEDSGIVLRDRLVVRAGRWYAIGCDCCPAEGTPLPEPADVPAVASYVALGRTVLPGRGELVALIDPLPPTARRAPLTQMAILAWQERFEWAGTKAGVASEARSGSADETPGPKPRTAAEHASADRSEGGAGPCVAPDDHAGGPEVAVVEEELSPHDFMVTESLVAWGGLLRGEIAGPGLEHWVPALVGPLRDPVLRDALIAWLCPGTVGLEAFDGALVELLDLHLGPEVRLEQEKGRSDGVGAGPAGGDPFGWREEVLGLGSDDWDLVDAPKMVQARLESVCRLTPAEHAAPLLSIVASYAWWSGDGARARVAVDRALSLEPQHRLCHLIAEGLDHGLRARPA
ncbi:hypothetical protein N865_01990 [Intrasporangium oryzae NRRL B-24470]|uniref:DUF4192 domain-containing protein n=1 Tax=Intrasporangium oryzae NRRL B-24470 TaxID=1386089 RepID=W9GEH4_9MICO|nr:DUF4192 domain-containing protein [Intrasporangium oryzae]EWT03228.1 hypothetical protein N865_01990 [Intrasporangium oryzae NRRL B-24470]